MTDWGANANAALSRAHRALIRGWDAGLDMARQLAWAQEVAEEADTLAEGQRERAERAERERDELRAGVLELHAENCIVHVPGPEPGNVEWWKRDGAENDLQKGDRQWRELRASMKGNKS